MRTVGVVRADADGGDGVLDFGHVGQDAPGATQVGLALGGEGDRAGGAQQQAGAMLNALVQHWQVALLQPLPLMPKTALCYLQTGDESKCRDMFEGGYQRSGERDNAPELTRYYPDFNSLLAAGFTDWAPKVYGPMLQTLTDNESGAAL